MGAIALILVACLPHSGQCKQVVQYPTPISHEDCSTRAEALQHRLAGSIDDSGYRPVQVICLYGDAEQEKQ